MNFYEDDDVGYLKKYNSVIDKFLIFWKKIIIGFFVEHKLFNLPKSIKVSRTFQL